jgi:serine/threonine protein kinase
VLSKLGKGAFGEVYKVRQIATGEEFAMKILDKENYFRSKLIRYAKTERDVLVMLNHPFITYLHSAFQTDTKLVLVMEYCIGGDMSKLLRRVKRLDEGTACTYICELVLALEELHRHNVIYRDLKPDNILFDSVGHAKISDFGLSKELIGTEDLMTKTFCGTISYIAPEVIRRRGYTSAVDWYTLGVVFYEMLEGRAPYTVQRRDLTIRNIMHGELTFRATHDDDLKDLVAKVRTIQLLCRVPDQRLGAKGAAEIKAHPYFLRKKINWGAAYNRQLPVLVPTEVPSKSRVLPKLSQILGEYSQGHQVENWSFTNCADKSR